MRRLVILMILTYPIFTHSGIICNEKIIDKPIIEKNHFYARVTYYNPDSNQTDSRPLETASGKLIDTNKLRRGLLKWIAVSRPLLKRFGGRFKYGDSLLVQNAGYLNGKYMIVDCMPSTKKYKIDILVHESRNKRCASFNKASISW